MPFYITYSDSQEAILKVCSYHCMLPIHRVAQNKIPHQTICNIFANSGQIFKILEAV